MNKNPIISGLIMLILFISACTVPGASQEPEISTSDILPEISTAQPTESESPSTVIPEITTTPIPTESGLPAEPRQITLEDDGKVLHLSIGERVLLMLGEGDTWIISIDNPSLISLVPGITVIKGAQGLYQADQAGSTTLQAVGEPLCYKQDPPCLRPSRLFEIQIVVEGGPLPVETVIPSLEVGISSLSMFSSTDGWALGWSMDGVTQTVLHTQDGGFSWLDVTPDEFGGHTYFTSYFMDTAHAWLSVNIGEPASSTELPPLVVYHTSDGGKSWQIGETLPGPGKYPGQMTFIDAQHGWMLADLGAAAGSQAVAIYQTQDSGINWKLASLTSGMDSESTPGSLPFQCSKGGLVFSSETTGWISGFCPGMELFFYVTHDGGVTWQREALPTPPGMPMDVFSQAQSGALPPDFVTAQDGFLPVIIYGEKQTVYIYITHDGGGIWLPYPSPTSSVLGSPEFVDAQRGWITDGEVLYQTSDGGQSWVSLGDLPTDEPYSNLRFANASDGWLSSGTQLFVTHDGGASWKVHTPIIH